MMDFLSFINKEALILIPILYIIGMMLKGTPKIKDWLIPYILLFLGILGANILLGFSLQASFQGILIAGAAVYTNQLYKQAINRNDPS